MRVGAIATMKRGLEQFIYRELQFFAAQGAEVSLFPTKTGPGPYMPDEGWEVHPWKPLQVLAAQPRQLLAQPRRYLRLLVEAIRFRALVDFMVAWYFASAMEGIDVIYSTFGDRKFFVGYFAKKIVNKPLVVTLHAYELYRNPNPRLFRRALASCDQIIAVSQYNRELLAREYGIPKRDVEVVRYSVDLEAYRPADKFVILIVAFFVERKGHDILFKAIKSLGRGDIEIWVVGDEGGERPVDVRGMAREIGVEAQVAYFGRLSGNALRAVFRECDLFCLPCRFDSNGIGEGFPNVLIEAMAMGKPTITTRHVEIPTIIPEILVDENDVEGLAQAIEGVYLSRERLAPLGEQNRRIAEQHFSPANAGQTIALLQRVARQATSAEALPRVEAFAE